MDATPPGRIVVLNGAPRAGKSSLAAAIQRTVPGDWLTLGVDALAAMIPPAWAPGIGLRPGGERPDLEPLVERLYAGLYEMIAAQSRLGFDVVVDVGHHDAYSRPLGILAACARRLTDLPAWLIGVRCPLDTILERRRQTDPTRPGLYLAPAPGEAVPAPILAWQEAVHRPGLYDLEVDSGRLSPDAAAAAIAAHLARGAAGRTAWRRLAATA